MNAGFLRNDPLQGLSVIGIVIVTDEEDCSSKDTRHFRPPAFLDPSDPQDAQLMQQGLNVRCHFSPGNLYSKERYVNGFKALRPGNEQLVVFGAIVGVPPAALAQMPSDYATNDVAREAFYDGIMQHPSMQPMVDTKDTPSPDDDSLTPSCETENGRAYAPRRIVEVARSFGGHGVVQSICQSDLGPAVEAIAGRIAAQLGAACLPRPLIASGGQVAGCDVLWALPVPAQAPANAPTSCAALSFLSPVGDDATTPDGGQLCAVAQLDHALAARLKEGL
jgi:hypothetical protein